MIKKYRYSRYSGITVVDVESETTKFVYIKGRREAKISDYCCYFRSFQEARDHVIALCEDELDRCKVELRRAEDKLKEAELLKDPGVTAYAGLKHSSMSQYVNEKRLGIADVQVISQHAKIESVMKYIDVDLERARELMETEANPTVERMRKVK